MILKRPRLELSGSRTYCHNHSLRLGLLAFGFGNIPSIVFPAETNAMWKSATLAVHLIQKIISSNHSEFYVSLLLKLPGISLKDAVLNLL